MPRIETWFPTLIYSDHLTEFTGNQYLAHRAELLRQQNSGTTATQWHCNTYNTLDTYDFQRHPDPVETELISLIHQRVIEFSRYYGVAAEHDQHLTPVSYWYNIAGPGAFQELHQHELCHFSVAYYVQARARSGDIVFKTLNQFHDMLILPRVGQTTTPATNRFCRYKPEPGRLLIFRSNLLHEVNPNLGSEDRVSISMNFAYR